MSITALADVLARQTTNLLSQLRQLTLDPAQRGQDRLSLTASITLDEVGGDCGRQHRQEADPKEHHYHRDDPTSDRLRVQIAVTHRRDGHHRPPDAVPGGVEIAAIDERLDCAAQDDDRECEQCDQAEGRSA